MKSLSHIVLLILICTCFNSCLKDETLHKYTYYVSVYSLKSEIRNNIKSTAPQGLAVTGKIYLQGNYIYINELGKGIHIVDYSKPSSPQNVAYIPIPGNVNLAIEGNYLYADEYSDLLTIDITNPLQAKLVNVASNAFPDVYNGLSDSLHMISDWRRIDTMITSHDKIITQNYPVPVYFDQAFASSSSSQKSQMSIGGSMASFAVLNNRLYTVTGSNLHVFNIENKSMPSFVQIVSTYLGNIETIYPFENNLFLGSNSGVYTYNADDADNPVYTGMFAHLTACDPVIADDKAAYVTLRDGTSCNGYSNELDVLNTTDISNPVLIKAYPFTNPRGLSKEGNYLFVCDGKDGLKIMNVADADNITQTKVISGFEANDVILNNGLAVVVATEGLYLIDYSDIDKAHVVSTIKNVK